MISKAVPHGEFETIWAIVNAADKVTAAEDKHNKGKFLNRQEFFQSLVRCAVSVYIRRGVGDVSDAVSQLLVSNLLGHLPAGAMQNSNAFRKRFCYIEKVSVVLEANLSSLQVGSTDAKPVSVAPPPGTEPQRGRIWPLRGTSACSQVLARVRLRNPDAVWPSVRLPRCALAASDPVRRVLGRVRRCA